MPAGHALTPALAWPFACGLLLGSIPFAWLIVRLTRGVDLTREGSGNVGARNSLRVSHSRGIGALALLLDVLKGAGAGLVGIALAPDAATLPWSWGAGTVGVLAGHVYNPWLSIARRRICGGKGFAALAGAGLVHAPWMVAVWLGVYWGTSALLRASRGIRDEAPGSLAAILAAPPAALGLYGVPEAIALGLCTLLILPRLLPDVRRAFAPRSASG